MRAAPTTLTSAEARRAARNAGAIAAASIVSRALQFGWQLILAPTLGPAAYGIYGTVAAFTVVGTAISNFGMGPIYIRDIARRPSQAGKYLTATLFMQTLLALLAYVGANAIAALAGYGEAVRVFLALAGISLIVDVLGNMCNDLLLAQERMVVASAVTIGHMIVLVALAGVGLAGGYSLFGVYAGMVGAGVLRTLALWALVLRAGTRPVWPFDRRIALPLLLNGAPLALAAFLNLAYQHADKLLTNRLIGDRETGYLSLAFIVIFGVVELLNTTILTATFPMMSRFYDDGRDPAFGFMAEKLFFFTLIICLPITLTLAIFAPDLIVPLFGTSFAPTADVLRILIGYALVTMTANVLAQGLMIQNRQRRLLVIRTTGLGINILLLLALLPALRVQGAAVASVCAELLVLALLLLSFRAVGWNTRKLLPHVGRLAALAGGVALAMILLRLLHPLIGIVAGLVLYAVGVLTQDILAREDWDLLYRLTAAMPGGALILRFWRRDTAINW